MAPVVNCNVANCSFWAKGNKCGAEEILVEIDGNSHNNDYEMEVSQDLTAHPHIEYADTSEETCCQTFKPKK